MLVLIMKQLTVDDTGVDEVDMSIADTGVDEVAIYWLSAYPILWVDNTFCTSYTVNILYKWSSCSSPETEIIILV